MPSPAKPSLVQEILTGTFTAEQLTAGTSMVVSSLIRIGVIVLISFLVMRVVSRLMTACSIARGRAARADP